MLMMRSVNITMNGEPLEEVTSFKYLGATLSKDGTCRAEIHIWIATATAAMARPIYVTGKLGNQAFPELTN